MDCCYTFSVSVIKCTLRSQSAESAAYKMSEFSACRNLIGQVGMSAIFGEWKREFCQCMPCVDQLLDACSSLCSHVVDGS